jgi:hypothetical protein
MKGLYVQSEFLENPQLSFFFTPAEIAQAISHFSQTAHLPGLPP